MKTWYKIYMAILSVVSTFLVLYIFSLQISNFVSTIVIVSYLTILLFTFEAFTLRIKLNGKNLRFLFNRLELNDIIDVRCGLFSTLIRTRWRVYRLPPTEECDSIKKLGNSRI
ncbi:hypothetical protein A4H02_00095 [Fervidobacterium thailandense]|uniref:Uncharacterized protein n=1 Tax=Fervidobacterium thailandense TaxID=1008305 RepID=A0A1E3G5T4_9BACT|nr:hypothetical protein A4H02_00095 [Fervidobacterium thailandense]